MKEGRVYKDAMQKMKRIQRSKYRERGADEVLEKG